MLHGQRVSGGYVLFQTKGNQWMIHRERLVLPATLRPMLATTAPAPRGSFWITRQTLSAEP